MDVYACQFQDGPIGLTLVDTTVDGIASVVVDEIAAGSQASRVIQLRVGDQLG